MKGCPSHCKVLIIKAARHILRVCVFFVLFLELILGSFAPVFAQEAAESVNQLSVQIQQLAEPFTGNHSITRKFGEKIDVSNVTKVSEVSKVVEEATESAVVDGQSATGDSQVLGVKQKLSEVEGEAGHNGLDFDMPEGTPVLAVDDGEVVSAGDGDYGITVIIKHSWGKSVYGHLKEIQKSNVKSQNGEEGQVIKAGDKVTTGQEIGLSGQTGLALGPHLHFGIKDNSGQWVDPAVYLSLNDKRLTTNADQVLGEATAAAALDVSPSASSVTFEDVSGDDSYLYNYKFNLANGTSAFFDSKKDPRPGFAIADKNFQYKLRFFLSSPVILSPSTVTLSGSEESQGKLREGSLDSSATPQNDNKNIAIQQFNNVSDPIVDGNRVDFPIKIGRAPATLRYTVLSDRVKEEIILGGKPEELKVENGELKIDFEVRAEGLTLGQSEESKSYSFKLGNGSTYWQIAEPTVKDANGKSGEVTGSLLPISQLASGSLIYTLTLTGDFLNKATYPVTVDPTVVIGDNSVGIAGDYTTWLASFLYQNPKYISMPIVARSKYSVSFKRPDGQIDAVISQAPVNYLDKLGNWQSIDTSLELTDGKYQGRGIETGIKPDGTVEQAGSSFIQKTEAFGYLNSQTGEFSQVGAFEGGKVEKNVFVSESGGFTHRLMVLDNGLKEELVVGANPKQTPVGDFLVLKTKVEGLDLADGLVENEFKLGEMTFPLPTSKDARGNEIETWRFAKKIGGSQYIFTGIPVRTLESAAFPVVIDPDLTGSTADGYVYGSSTSSYSAARSTSTGYDSGTNSVFVGQYFSSPTNTLYRGYLLFDTSSIGSSATVTQANLKLVAIDDHSVANDFDVYIVKQDWSAQNPLSATNREAAYDNALTSAKDDNTWRNTSGMSLNTQYTSGNLNTAWVSKTGTTYYSLASNRDYDGSGTPGGGFEYIGIASANHATAGYRPVLTVAYTTNQNPNSPSSLGGASLVNGSSGSNNTPTLSFTLSDPDGADTVKYQIQIDDTSDFSSPVVDYTSALAAQGSTSFTVGQAAGSGSYTTGSSGQTLSDGSYYWQVKAIDNSAAASAYTQANSGAIAFKVDTTAPSAPTNVTSSLVLPKQAKISWDAVSGASLYYVYKSTTSSSSGFTVIGSPTTMSQHYDMGCTTHWFYVTALDSVSNESAASSVVQVSPNCSTSSSSSSSSTSSSSSSSTSTTSTASQALVVSFQGPVTSETQEETGKEKTEEPQLSLPTEPPKTPQFNLPDVGGQVEKVLAGADEIKTVVIAKLTDSVGFLFKQEEKLELAIYNKSRPILLAFGRTTSKIKGQFVQVKQTLASNVANFFGWGKVKGAKTELAYERKLLMVNSEWTRGLRFVAGDIRLNAYALGFEAGKGIKPYGVQSAGYSLQLEQRMQKQASLALGKIQDTSYKLLDTSRYWVKDLGQRLIAGSQLFWAEVIDRSPTKISNVAIANVNSKTVIISWKTSHPTTSKVNYGFDTSYGMDVQDSKYTQNHKLTLTNLDEDRTYYFEVMGQGKDYVYDAYYTFTTPKE